jgi:arylsulfatase A
LIVRWPDVVPPASVCKETVTSTDFFPTVRDIIAADGSQQQATTTDGVSLLPILTSTGQLSREAIYWHYPHYNPIGGFPYGAIRQGDWKLIEFYEDNHTELYNLRDDISETADVATERPEIVSELTQELRRWRASVKAQMPQARQSTSSDRAGI